MAKPFLKWAGGKTQLLKHLLAAAPQHCETYYEPFLGGGALFFALQAEACFERAILSDSNEELINCYRQVRDRPDDLIAALDSHQRRYLADGDDARAGYFYAIRAEQPSHDLGRAARLIFLNKTCFNGLYRVNSAGRFNVPHGRYANPTICDESGLRTASQALQGADIRVADFEDPISAAAPGDFVYFDPPYVPLSPTANFTAYTADAFGMDDQLRLANAAASLDARGVPTLLSNSGHLDVQRLYRQVGMSLREVHAVRAINSNANGRGAVREALIVGAAR